MTETENHKLNVIVQGITDECQKWVDAMQKELDERGGQVDHEIQQSSIIDCWKLKIDNIPVELTITCRIRTSIPRLELVRELEWVGDINLMDNKNDAFGIEFYPIHLKENVIDRNDMTRNIIKIFDVSNLKFSKVRNYFMEKNSIFDAAIDYFKLDWDCDECCVCYDKTATITPCGHHICLECVSKIKIYNCECENCKGQVFKRPMCKKGVGEVKNNY